MPSASFRWQSAAKKLLYCFFSGADIFPGNGNGSAIFFQVNRHSLGVTAQFCNLMKIYDIRSMAVDYRAIVQLAFDIFQRISQQSFLLMSKSTLFNAPKPIILSQIS